MSESGKTLDEHLYYRIEKKCEYMGIQFKKGEYISLDTRHWEWEWFGKNKKHKGAISPLSGELYKKAEIGRVIYLP